MGPSYFQKGYGYIYREIKIGIAAWMVAQITFKMINLVSNSNDNLTQLHRISGILF